MCNASNQLQTSNKNTDSCVSNTSAITTKEEFPAVPSSTFNANTKIYLFKQVSDLPSVIRPLLPNTGNKKTSEVIMDNVKDDNKRSNCSLICKEISVGNLPNKVTIGGLLKLEELNGNCINSLEKKKGASGNNITPSLMIDSASSLPNSQLQNQVVHSVGEQGHIHIGIDEMLVAMTNLLSEVNGLKELLRCPLCSYKNSDTMFLLDHLTREHLSSNQIKSEKFHCLHCKFVSLPVAAPCDVKQYQPNGTGHCQQGLPTVATSTKTNSISHIPNGTSSTEQIDVEFSSSYKAQSAILSNKCDLKSMTMTATNKRFQMLANEPKILLRPLPEKSCLEKSSEASAERLNSGNDPLAHGQVFSNSSHTVVKVKFMSKFSLECYKYRGPWLNRNLICKIMITGILGNQPCPRYHSPICAYHNQDENSLKHHLLKYHLAAPRCDDGSIACCHCPFRCDSDKNYQMHYNLKHFPLFLCSHCSMECSERNQLYSHLNVHISPFDKLKSITGSKYEKKTPVESLNQEWVPSSNIGDDKTLLDSVVENHADEPRTERKTKKMWREHVVMSSAEVEAIQSSQQSHPINSDTVDTSSGVFIGRNTLINSSSSKLEKIPLVSHTSKSKMFYSKENIVNLMRLLSPVMFSAEKKRRFCPYCKILYSSGFQLSLHILTQHLSHQTDTNNKNIKCPHCDCTFALDHLFSKHMNLVHGRKYCPQCPFMNTKVLELLDHIVSTHFEELAKVDQDKQAFINIEIIQKELEIAVNINLRKCPLCPRCSPKPMRSPKSLQSHLIYSHLASKRTAQGSIMCCHCVQEFQSDFVYRMHVKLVHDKKGLRYCPLCPCKLTTNMTPHIIEAHGSMFPTPNLLPQGSPAENRNGDDTIVSISSLLQNSNENQSFESNRVRNDSFSNINVGGKVKPVDECCNSQDGDNSGAGSDYQVLSTESEKLQEGLRKPKKIPVCSSDQSTWFLKKNIIMAELIKMFGHNINVDHPKQQCPLCKSLYQYTWMLYLHMMTDHVSLETDRTGMKKKCPHCKECFLLDEQFFFHMKNIHCSDAQNCCPYCPYTSSSLRVFYDHTVSIHFKKLEKLPHLHRIFRSAKEIQTALQFAEKRCDFQLCPFCAFKTTAADANRALLFHLYLYHLTSERTANLKINCCHCLRRFQSDLQYRTHIEEMHDGNGLQHCPFCPSEMKHLLVHIDNAHGFTIGITPQSSVLKKNLSQDNAVEVSPKSFLDTNFSHQSNKMLLIGQEQHIGRKFESSRSGKASAEWDESCIGGILPSSKLDQEQRPVKRRKICPVDSIISDLSNCSSANLATAMVSPATITKPSITGMLCDRSRDDPKEQGLTAQSNLNRLDNLAKFQTMKERTCRRDVTKQCPFCCQSIHLEVMYEHLLWKHKHRNDCLHCNLQFRTVEDLFEHTGKFHFKMPGKIPSETHTVYYTAEALRQKLRKALLDLHVKMPSQTTLTHCPLCFFVCKVTYNLKKYLSHHLVLHHLVTKCTPQSNNIKCPHCSATFVSDPEFRNHLKVQHNASHTFYCPFCPFKCAAHLAFLLHDVTAIHGVHLLPEIRLDAKVLLRDNISSATAQRPLDSCDRLYDFELKMHCPMSCKEKLHPRLTECEEKDVKCKAEIDGPSLCPVDDSSIGCLRDDCFMKSDLNTFSTCEANVHSSENEDVTVKTEECYQSPLNHEQDECPLYDAVSVKFENDIDLYLSTQPADTTYNFVTCNDGQVTCKSEGN